MTLERTIRELKEANTIGPNPRQLKVKDFFPLITNEFLNIILLHPCVCSLLSKIYFFVKMSSSNHEKMLNTMKDMYKINPKKFEDMMGGK